MEKIVKVVIALSFIALIASGMGIYGIYTVLQEIGVIKNQVAIIVQNQNIMLEEPNLKAFWEAYEEQPELVLGAAKEGKVVLYSHWIITDNEAIVKAFTKKYPFIKAEFYRDSGWPLYEKYMTEARAGLSLADVFVAAPPVLMQLKTDNKLVSYKSPQLKYFDPKYIDPENYLTTLLVSVQICVVNKNLILPNLRPSDYTDFINPRPEWRDIILWDPQVLSAAYSFLAQLYQNFGENTTRDIWKGLGTLRPFYSTGAVQTAEKLSSGENPIALMSLGSFKYVQYVVEKGAPLEVVWLKSGASGSSESCSVLEAAPHPNAARLFLNFLLSKEVANLFSAPPIYRYPTRTDATPPPQLPPLADVKLMPFDESAAALMHDELIAKWIEWMGY